MEENELLLFDRLEVIKKTIAKYGEDKFYISFSGGKDSTVLHHLIDMALPDNNIPRVFVNTGIEFNDIVSFVKELAEHDKRFVIINPSKPIKKMLEEYGYPFKSKLHSHMVGVYQRNGKTLYVSKYLKEAEGNKTMVCPQKLKYQFTDSFNIRLDNKCCDELKKKPIKKWEKENSKNIAITGMRVDEKGARIGLKCVITDKDNNIVKFHPLSVVSNELEEWFIKKFKIELCELYYPPFNFERTGCKGCPFAITLQEQLDKMERYLPAERKQCEFIWKPVYDEYRRIGYRLKSYHYDSELFPESGEYGVLQKEKIKDQKST